MWLDFKNINLTFLFFFGMIVLVHNIGIRAMITPEFFFKIPCYQKLPDCSFQEIFSPRDSSEDSDYIAFCNQISGCNTTNDEYEMIEYGCTKLQEFFSIETVRITSIDCREVIFEVDLEGEYGIKVDKDNESFNLTKVRI